MIVDTSGNEFAFSHSMPTFEFVWLADSKQIKSDADTAFTPMGDLQTRYAMFGPYTWWLIELDPNANPGIVLSAVSSAYLEFHFTHYAFQ